MTSAVYAFSGDPVTFGHIDIIKRAAKAFDKLVVAIGHNPAKKYTFSLADRTEMAKTALKSYTNVTVEPFEGLLVDFAYMNGISVIIRGIRNGKDFDYENELYHVNASQKLDIDTYFLPSKQDLTHVSSSNVKALQLEHGLVHEYVPINVKKRLEETISGQYIIGITGEIGAGKSYVGEKLVEIAKEQGIEAHNIDMDSLGHELYSGGSPLSQRVIKEIIQEFNVKLELYPPVPPSHPWHSAINRKKLGEIVFKDKSSLLKLNQIMHEPLMVMLRKAIYGKKGFIFLNAALLAEMKLEYLFNSNTIIVDVDKKVQWDRLKQRPLSDEQINRRINSQYRFGDKLSYLASKVVENGGRIWPVKSDSNLEDLFQRLYEWRK